MKRIYLQIPLILFSINIFGQINYLPEWVFNTKYYNNDEYMIGISDPVKDSILAFNQAVQRAYLNYGILHKERFASLTAVAEADSRENSKIPNSVATILYSNMLRSGFVLKDSFELIKKDFSHYGECFVLFHKTTKSLIKPIKIDFEVIRNTGFYQDDNQMPVSYDELATKTIINSIPVANYTISRDVLSGYSIISVIKNKRAWNEINVQSKFRDYANNHYEDEEYYQCSENLSYGWWAAYLYALSDQITIYSILNRNKTHRLVSIHQGTIQNNIEHSLTEFLRNTQKIQLQAMDIKLKSIKINQGKLIIEIAHDNDFTKLKYAPIASGRKERKIIKNMKTEHYREYNLKDPEKAYYAQKYYRNTDNYIYSESTTRSGSLAQAIIHGVLTASLGIENQLETKITTLSSLENSNDKSSVVQNSKLLTNVKNQIIFPYFFFINEIKPNVYSVKTKLFLKKD